MELLSSEEDSTSMLTLMDGATKVMTMRISEGPGRSKVVESTPDWSPALGMVKSNGAAWMTDDPVAFAHAADCLDGAAEVPPSRL